MWNISSKDESMVYCEQMLCWSFMGNADIIIINCYRLRFMLRNWIFISGKATFVLTIAYSRLLYVYIAERNKDNDWWFKVFILKTTNTVIAFYLIHFTIRWVLIIGTLVKTREICIFSRFFSRIERIGYIKYHVILIFSFKVDFFLPFSI